MRLPALQDWFRRDKGPDVTREEALGAQPLRNPAITWEVLDSGRVLLSIPLAARPWVRLVNWLVPVPTDRKVELDEVGSDVWQWCDGERTVAELVRELARAHKLNQREAEVSLTQFLQLLAKRRFLGLKLQVDEQRKEAIAQAVANKGPRAGGRR